MNVEAQFSFSLMMACQLVHFCLTHDLTHFFHFAATIVLFVIRHFVSFMVHMFPQKSILSFVFKTGSVVVEPVAHRKRETVRLKSLSPSLSRRGERERRG